MTFDASTIVAAPRVELDPLLVLLLPRAVNRYEELMQQAKAQLASDPHIQQSRDPAGIIDGLARERAVKQTTKEAYAKLDLPVDLTNGSLRLYLVPEGQHYSANDHEDFEQVEGPAVLFLSSQQAFALTGHRGAAQSLDRGLKVEGSWLDGCLGLTVPADQVRYQDGEAAIHPVPIVLTEDILFKRQRRG